jgi:hypothetical protein
MKRVLSNCCNAVQITYPVHQEDSPGMQEELHSRTTSTHPAYNSHRPGPKQSSGHNSSGSLGGRDRLAANGRRPARMTAATDGTTTERGVGQPPPDRITIALIPKAVAELQRLQDRTGLSKTDLVNRAISLYEFINEQTGAGRDLLLRDKKTGDTQLVRLL